MVRKNSKKTDENDIRPTEEKTESLSPLKKASLAGVAQQSFSPDELAAKIAGFLDEKKARDISLIDISKKTIIADYFVIATGSSTTAVRALSEYVDEKLSKNFGIEPLRRDEDSKWFAIDYGSVIMHIFHEETRNFYQLERLWSDGDNTTRFTK